MTTEMVKAEHPVINTIQIGDYEVSIEKYQGERVVAFKDIDIAHERPDGTAKRNFKTNRKYFIEGVDFFIVKPSDIQKDEIRRCQTKKDIINKIDLYTRKFIRVCNELASVA